MQGAKNLDCRNKFQSIGAALTHTHFAKMKRKHSEVSEKVKTDKPEYKSSLKMEEGAFPRGGAGVLSAMEIRQTADDAAKDLFEESKAVKGSKKKGSKKTKRADDDIVAIQSLSLDNITVGSILLGRIAQIQSSNCVISLPNNLHGFVSGVQVSEALNAKIEADEDFDLSDYVKEGQWVRAAVVDTSNKRLSLSLLPKDVNAGISDTDIDANMALQIEVKSKEDKGYVVATGLKGKKGFIKGTDTELNKGQIVLASVVRVSGRTITLDTEHTGEAVRQLEDFSGAIAGIPVTIVTTDKRPNGAVVSVFGSVDATIDPFQGSFNLKEKTSSTARVVALLDRGASGKRMLLSSLPHVVNLEDADPRIGEAFLPGQVLEDVKVTHAVSQGLFVELAENVPGFIHITKLSDEKTESTADYEAGQTIKARIMAFSPLDEMYVLSCAESVMEAEYLATSDLVAGQKVEGTVTKHLPKGGLIVALSSFVSAMVPAAHLVDTKVANPELKFKIGSKVKGRIIGVDDSHMPRMTVKKSLFNLPKDDFITYDSQIGDIGTGTIVHVKPTGCVVEFWDNSQAFQPAGEVSEAFISDISKHCRAGQTVKVRVLDVNPEKKSMQVSCKLSTVASEHVATAYEDVAVGDLVSGKIIDKRGDFVVEMTVGDVDLTGIVPRSLLPASSKKLRVGEQLECVVLAKQPWMNSMTLGAHPDIMKAYHNKTLIKETPSAGQAVTGWVNNVNQHGAFVSFAGVSGLAPQSTLSDTYTKFQVVKGRVTSVDGDKFYVSIGKSLDGPAVNPVDPSISTIADYTEGKQTEGVVTSVLPAFISVRLADNQNGKISLSQLESPVEKGEKISVTVLGPSSQGDLIELATNNVRLTVTDLEADETYSGVVVLATSSSIWVALSAYIVGRVDRADVQEEDFSDVVGDIVDVAVCGVEGDKVKLRGAESKEKSKGFSDEPLPASSGLEGAVVTARVKKIEVDGVQCTVSVNGKSSLAKASLVDALDDYSKSLSSVYDFGDSVSAVICSPKEPYAICIRKNEGGVDPLPALPFKRGDKVKGVITGIGAGVFVAIGHGVSGRIKITNLSDSFLMDWKKYFKIGQIVNGRIMAFSERGLPEISLKQRHMVGDKLIEGPQDLVVGNKYDGSVQRTTEYGVFVNIGDAVGLCHRSEIADTPVADCTELFNAGDKVRVIVLKLEDGKVGLGMKAAYFEDDEDEEAEDSDDDMEVDVEESEDEEEDEEEDDEEADSEDEDEDDSDEESAPTIRSAKKQAKDKSGAMDVGFDWSGDVFNKEQEKDGSDDDSDDDSDEESDAPKSRKKRKTQIADITADLSTATPQSVGDYERLLVGNPNSSVLWISYMSFVMQLSELEKAREIAQRALKTIAYRDEDEKLNVWLALLNLENTFGTPESTDKTFKDAAQYMDAETIYMKMGDIYDASDKKDKADEVYSKAVKKFSGSMEAWIRYATFLFDNEQAAKGRVLLDRATKALPKRDHLQCAIKFAQLEYKSGDAERGRTLLEGLVSVYPKRTDLWSQFVDFEIKYGQDKTKIEALFERVVALPKLSLKQAKFFFKKWYQYEVEADDDKAAEYVKAKAADYVTQRTKDEEDDEEDDE